MTATVPPGTTGPAAVDAADFRHLADHLLALDAGRLPPRLPAHLRGHAVAQLAARGELDRAVMALMGDVPNPWLGLLHR